MRLNLVRALLPLALLIAGPAYAGGNVITLKHHAFSPQEIIVPAHQKITITVKNEDNTHADFGSWDLNREKALDPESKTTLFIGPLDPGRYRYYDDYHRFGVKDRRDFTYGFIIAK